MYGVRDEETYHISLMALELDPLGFKGQVPNYSYMDGLAEKRKLTSSSLRVFVCKLLHRIGQSCPTPTYLVLLGRKSPHWGG